MNLNYFLARRIYGKDGDKKKVSVPAIRIATIGVAVGLTVMILTVCVVLGFKSTIQQKISTFVGDMQIQSFKSYQTGMNEPLTITDSLIDAISSTSHVTEYQNYAYVQGILKTDSDFLGVYFRGQDEPKYIEHQKSNAKGLTPDDERQKSSFLSQGNKEGGAVISVSKTIADKLHLKIGDKVFAYFIGSDNVRTRKFKVTDIYESNMSQFDKTLCFIDISTVRKLNNWDENQVSGIQIMLDDQKNIPEAALEMQPKVKSIGFESDNQSISRTVQEMYPGMFAWLDLLDINVWIILALMVCIAGFTMISGLLIIILERTQMIGVLKALGARNKSIRHTFLWFASFIIGNGMLWGNIIGIGIAVLQKYTGFIKLDASNYYVDTVPMLINIPLLVLLNIATLVISVMVLVIPSHLITKISPSKSMRYE